ncbi:MAG: hypothetical protein QOI36_297, partial [Pseudonocardiales bacterium]|nr:hypothetical protein [Pseudonocardiales bacterium]
MRVLGVTVRATTPLGGGAARADLADGRIVVVKGVKATAEAAGLRWLRVPGGPPVPKVLDVDPERLVTEFVPAGAPDAGAAAALGSRLARMHAAGAGAFGAAP